jgi:hypothetical protein
MVSGWVWQDHRVGRMDARCWVQELLLVIELYMTSELKLRPMAHVVDICTTVSQRPTTTLTVVRVYFRPDIRNGKKKSSVFDVRAMLHSLSQVSLSLTVSLVAFNTLPTPGPSTQSDNERQECTNSIYQHVQTFYHPFASTPLFFNHLPNHYRLPA